MDIQVSVDVSALHGATQGRYSIHIVKSLDTFRMFRLEWEQLESASEIHSFCLTYRYCELAAERSLAAGELVVRKQAALGARAWLEHEIPDGR